jgi:Spy/CpxP family protein refolding chaperone
MRKTTMTMALGLALSLGAVGAVSAQATQQPQRQEHAGRGMRRGPGGELFKGITLTQQQKDRLKALRKDRKPNAELRTAMQEVRALRQKGDTAAARAKMQALRPQFEQERERQFAAMRSILTPEQQKQFDANVAQWKQHAAQRENAGWEGHGRGHNGQHAGSPNDR